MLRHPFLITLALLGMFAQTAAADDEKPTLPLAGLPLPGGDQAASLSGTLRGLLIKLLPATLYQASPGWGKTTRVVTGVKWKGKGIGHPTARHADRNHGTWRKVRGTADRLADTLVLDLRDLKQQSSGALTFTLFLSFDTKVYLEQQKWARGIRLYDGSLRARLRIKLKAQCEVNARLEPSRGLMPDAVIQFKVLRSEAGYDNLVFEHFAGFGGTSAKLIGEAVVGGLKKWHPSLERSLLDRANAAIMKAGASREVRLNLGKLLNLKK